MTPQELNKLSLGDYANRDRPAIYPEKFWTDTKENPADPVNPIKFDMVQFVKVGAPGTAVVERIDRLQKRPAYWAVIGPRYEAWKKGHEVPVDGTPLTAWPGCRPEEAERFHLMRIYTVQDVAKMTEADMDRYGMGARDKRSQALAFLEAGDRAKVAGESEQLKKDLADTKAELAEALAAIRELSARVPQGDNVDMAPPRRGRPPKAA